jgi:hypothetical protein
MIFTFIPQRQRAETAFSTGGAVRIDIGLLSSLILAVSLRHYASSDCATFTDFCLMDKGGHLSKRQKDCNVKLVIKFNIRTSELINWVINHILTEENLGQNISTFISLRLLPIQLKSVGYFFFLLILLLVRFLCYFRVSNLEPFWIVFKN